MFGFPYLAAMNSKYNDWKPFGGHHFSGLVSTRATFEVSTLPTRLIQSHLGVPFVRKKKTT